MNNRATLILGVGNLLMGDEGIGVHAITYLQSQSLPGGTTLLDGGTTGFHLISCFEDYNPVIMIDATMDGKPPGTVSLLEPRFARDFPRALTAHDIGLRDLIETASLLHPLPRIFLVTVSIAAMQSMSTDLTPAIRDSLGPLTTLIRKILADALN